MNKSTEQEFRDWIDIDVIFEVLTDALANHNLPQTLDNYRRVWNSILESLSEDADMVAESLAWDIENKWQR